MCADVHRLEGLYFWFGVVVGFGTGFGYATPIPVMAKWFPDHRGLAVGLAVAGFGGGSAIFGPLCAKWLIPSYGHGETFRILIAIFLVMTGIAGVLLRDPPQGYRPKGWVPPDPTTETAATRYDFTPTEVLRTRAFYLIWIAFALGTSAGLMVISQLIPFAKEKGISANHASTALLVGAIGSAAGRALSGWLSDSLGRLNVLRLMIGISMLAMPFLDRWGGDVTGLLSMVFVIYWCFGTQLSVNASTTADFWGTKNAGINYGMLYTAYGVEGILGPWIGSAFFDHYHSYKDAFTTAGTLAAIALVCECLARRPKVLASTLS